jgi:hypothetical protein
MVVAEEEAVSAIPRRLLRGRDLVKRWENVVAEFRIKGENNKRSE